MKHLKNLKMYIGEQKTFLNQIVKETKESKNGLKIMSMNKSDLKL